MTIGEFKAWFKGYTESCGMIHEMDIERVKEKLAEVIEFTYTPNIEQVPISIPTVWYPAVQPNVPWEPFIVTTGGTTSCEPLWDLSWDMLNCNDVPVTTREWQAWSAAQ